MKALRLEQRPTSLNSYLKQASASDLQHWSHLLPPFTLILDVDQPKPSSIFRLWSGSYKISIPQPIQSSLHLRIQSVHHRSKSRWSETDWQANVVWSFSIPLWSIWQWSPSSLSSPLSSVSLCFFFLDSDLDDLRIWCLLSRSSWIEGVLRGIKHWRLGFNWSVISNLSITFSNLSSFNVSSTTTTSITLSMGLLRIWSHLSSQ